LSAKTRARWYSSRIHGEVNLVRWGHYGAPVLLFPTAGGDAEECERFQLIDALGGLLEAGRIKVYSLDSIAGAAWTSGRISPAHCAWLQNQFDACVYHEVVRAIRTDCLDEVIEPVAAGASIGAFNAVASLCRHPDVFRLAIGMSGTYDLRPWLRGEWHDDFYYSSPLDYLPGLGEGWQLDQLRRRFILLATGSGAWEEPEQSWRVARVLGDKRVPNRVDDWGPAFEHDWPTWRQMLPKYLSEIA
jgi:esterase/lipase superfamily enzyme